MATHDTIERKKVWLRRRLEAIRRRQGTDGLSYRELGQRAGLHPQEVHRWLNAEHLPTERSVYEFTLLLRAIEATQGDIATIVTTLGLGGVWDANTAAWYQHARTLLKHEDWIIFVFHSADTGQVWHIAERSDPLHYRLILEGGLHKYWDPALSNDGRLLITIEQYPSAEHALEIWHPQGRAYEQERRLPLRYASRGAWSPDGMAIACEMGLGPTRQPRVITLYDLQTDTPHQLTDGQSVDCWPAWSADGSVVAFQRNDELWAVEPATAKTWPLVDRSRTGGHQVWAPAFAPDGERVVTSRGSISTPTRSIA